LGLEYPLDRKCYKHIAPNGAKDLSKDKYALEQARASRIDCPRPRIEFADNLIYQETRL